MMPPHDKAQNSMPRLAASMARNPGGSKAAGSRQSGRCLLMSSIRAHHSEACMSYETILFEARGPIGILTFNRPDRLNAFNQKLVDEVTRQLDLVEAEESIRVLVVAGAGRASSAGFDLKEGAARPWNTVADVTPVLRKDFDFV